MKSRILTIESLHPNESIRDLIAKRRRNLAEFEIVVNSLDFYESPDVSYDFNSITFHRIHESFVNSFGSDSVAIAAPSYDLPQSR